MTVNDFRKLLSAQPFQPFRVVMSSGEKYEVRHPEMAWLTRTTLYVGTGHAQSGVPDEADMCSLLHIATVEPINGRSSRRR